MSINPPIPIQLHIENSKKVNNKDPSQLNEEAPS
jgi:hypothetical protein